MMGWHITLSRQENGGVSPATSHSDAAAELAVWQTDVGGLHWLDELVAADRAIDLGGNGYPSCYTARAEEVLCRIVAGPPAAREAWICGPDDVISDKWAGRTVLNEDQIADCRPDEWLLVVAWDES